MELGKQGQQHAIEKKRIFVTFETFCFQTLLGPTQVGSVHVNWKFPEAVMEGSRPDTVSLLNQKIANCGLIIQIIQVDLNRLSSSKTKEQLNKYNRCAEQLDKARKVYQSKVQQLEELQSLLL